MGGGGGISLISSELRSFLQFWHAVCICTGVPKRVRLGLRLRDGAGGSGLNGFVHGLGPGFPARTLGKGKRV